MSEGDRDKRKRATGRDRQRQTERGREPLSLPQRATFRLLILFQVFQYDRFVGERFFKNGKELKQPVLAFGSLCPGKNFALFELKWYLISMFSRFEMKMAEGQKAAECDFRYHGHEVLPPVADVNVSLTLKENAPLIELV